MPSPSDREGHGSRLALSSQSVKPSLTKQLEVSKQVKLSELSEKDGRWDTYKSHNEQVRDICAKAQDAEAGMAFIAKWEKRLDGCVNWLDFAEHATSQGEMKLKLVRANFCHVRHCPACQWRRSMMIKARFFEALPAVIEQHKASRWMMLTLTVRNCEVDQLGETLKAMNEAWGRLVKTNVFKDVLGWVRATEVTRSRDGKAHPHFHILLMVKSTYFKPGHYIKTSGWVEAWRDAGRLGYDPVCDVRTVKPNKKGDWANADKSLAMAGAVAEVLKYATKSKDLIQDPDWTLEFFKQVHHKRFLAAGGALKDAIKKAEAAESDEAFIEAEKDETQTIETGVQMRFTWRTKQQAYYRKSVRTVPPSDAASADPSPLG
ncbi:MAG: hypothetical protein DDT34_01510 [Firmicutes bacterium]|nr:hypothetical protein [Bacillota bacterium]